MNTLEPRVAKLEAHAEHILDDLKEMKTDIRDVRERLISVEAKLTTKPGYWAAISIAISIVLAIGAIIAFQEAIQAYLSPRP